jgi:hypothetical protein
MKEMELEISCMKIVFHTVGYFVLLFFSLNIALNTYVDMADPPVVNPDIDHSFWLSGFGGWLWFGMAFVLPAVVLFAFSYSTRRIWRGVCESSHAPVQQH